ncbi:MAG: copper homeostasis protein CutC [Vicinamibacterales bacterium]
MSAGTELTAMIPNIVFEACVDSVESAVAAQRGGANRVELCSALMEGGLTPSLGMLRVAREMLQIGIMALVRPRGGDFCYTDTEYRSMLHDIDAARVTGANGIVFGILNPDGSVDERRTRAAMEVARPLPVTFHRAFDMTRDPFEALDTLIDLGIDRVLTSGQEASVVEGLDLIAALVERAAGRIIVVPGGGVTERNVRKVVAATGVREVHFYGGAEVASPMAFRNARVFMGGTLRPPEYSREVLEPEYVRRLMSAAL